MTISKVLLVHLALLTYIKTTLTGPITTYEEFYGKIMGDISALASQQLQGSFEQDGNSARMTCKTDVANGECLKWVRQDNPFDKLQVLHSSESCEGKDKHPNYDTRKSFYSMKSGSTVTSRFEFENMRDDEKGVYYCYQIDTVKEPYHRWKTFVVQ